MNTDNRTLRIEITTKQIKSIPKDCVALDLVYTNNMDGRPSFVIEAKLSGAQRSHLTFYFGCEGGQEMGSFHGSISQEMLLKSIKGLKIDSLFIAIESGQHKLTLRDENGVKFEPDCKFAIHDWKRDPLPNLGERKGSFRLPIPQLKKINQFHGTYYQKQANRIVWESMNIECDDDGSLTTVTTNGMILKRLCLDVPTGESGSTTCSFTLSNELLSYMLLVDNSAIVTVHESGLSIDCYGNYSVVMHRGGVDYCYPNYRQAIPKHNDVPTWFEISHSDITAAIKKLKPYFKDWKIIAESVFKFDGSGKLVLDSGKMRPAVEMAVLSPQFGIPSEIALCLNLLSYVVDGFKQGKGNLVLKMRDKESPAIWEMDIEGTSSAIVVQMPVRIN